MQAIHEATKDAIKALYDIDISVILSRPDPQFGDFATNVALQIAKKVEKNPRSVAEQLVPILAQKMAGIVSDVTIAGPGFINFLLTDETLLKELEQANRITPTLAGKTVLVEYSDPNPFKPLHAGHLYTTLVGNAVARLVAQSGATVVRINYGGDVGLHVGKTMWSILNYFGGEYPEKLDAIAVDERPDFLGARYVEGNTAYEEDEQSKQAIVAVNKRVYALHQDNDRQSNFAKIYWTCRTWSYEYFKQLYSQLQIDPFDRFIPESEVTELGIQTVKTQLAQGVYKESDGAVIYDGDAKGNGLHTRVFINSAGLPTYEAKETGLIQTKWNDYQYDQSIVITANEQDQYMKVVFASVAEFEPELIAKTKHISHGVVKLSGGVKMSSRKGNTVSALDIISAARSASERQNKGATEETVLAAIKYAFAKTRIGPDIIYEPQDSVALEGNSGPYLQYAHARARSILDKVASSSVVAPAALESGERDLVVKLTQYGEIIEQAVSELMPHIVCAYLYELAQVFNRFYEHNRVIDDPRQAERLFLVRAYADTLRRGLDLLGIASPDSM